MLPFDEHKPGCVMAISCLIVLDRQIMNQETGGRKEVFVTGLAAANGVVDMTVSRLQSLLPTVVNLMSAEEETGQPETRIPCSLSLSYQCLHRHHEINCF